MAKTTDLHSAQAKATVRAPVPDALKLYIIQQVYLGNLTIDAAIATGHISRSQLYKELKIYRETGQITERKKSTGTKAKAPPEARAYVLALFQHRPSMYLREAVDMLNHHFGILVDKSTISDWLKQDGLSHKKLTKTATQQDEDLRIDYTLHMGQYLPQQLVFADETHFDQRNANRSMGWAETGRRAEVRQDFRRTGGLSVLPAIDHNGILAAWCVDGAVDGDMFTYWVEHFLLPEMNPFPGPRSVLVLDNCNIHKATTTREKVEAKGEQYVLQCSSTLCLVHWF
ncbi:unnamed protein product [Tilletia controversa]|nr:unnamed protein product [Tilletia controversa]